METPNLYFAKIPLRRMPRCRTLPRMKDMTLSEIEAAARNAGLPGPIAHGNIAVIVAQIALARGCSDSAPEGQGAASEIHANSVPVGQLSPGTQITGVGFSDGATISHVAPSHHAFSAWAKGIGGWSAAARWLNARLGTKYKRSDVWKWGQSEGTAKRPVPMKVAAIMKDGDRNEPV